MLGCFIKKIVYLYDAHPVAQYSYLDIRVGIITVQPKSSFLRKDFCQKKLLFRDWSMQLLGPSILSAHKGAIIFLVGIINLWFAITVGIIYIG